MGCATGVVKYLVFLANLIFAIAGLALVIVGIMYKYNYNEVSDVLPSDFNNLAVLSIIIGAVVFVTAFLGCCGAVKESSCMLTTYAVILLTIFIIQVAIGIYAFLQIKNDNNLDNTVHNKLQNIFDKYDRDEKSREFTDVIQRLLQCCGLDNPQQMTLADGISLPRSCCRVDTQQCRTTDHNAIHSQGCSKALRNFLQDKTKLIAQIAIGVAVFEIIGSIFGFCLAGSVRHHYRRNTYA